MAEPTYTIWARHPYKEHGHKWRVQWTTHDLRAANGEANRLQNQGWRTKIVKS